MKPLILFSATLIFIQTAMADGSRYVTVTCPNPNNPGAIQVLDGETAEIVSCTGNANPTLYCNIVKDGSSFLGFPCGYSTWALPKARR